MMVDADALGQVRLVLRVGLCLRPRIEDGVCVCDWFGFETADGLKT
jgi:hypothetical protein